MLFLHCIHGALLLITMMWPCPLPCRRGFPGRGRLYAKLSHLLEVSQIFFAHLCAKFIAQIVQVLCQRIEVDVQLLGHNSLIFVTDIGDRGIIRAVVAWGKERLGYVSNNVYLSMFDTRLQ